MTAEQFVAKWTKAELSERAASQEHFIDLCRLLGQPTPAQSDPTGESYCFEKAVKVVAAASKGSKGDGGFVDVWKRGCFGWEYKRKDKYKSLDEAYRQLYQYRDALDNPPLSVVCDIRTVEIRTHFTGYPTVKTVIKLEEFPAKLDALRNLFTNPLAFRPLKAAVDVTKDLSKEFAELADALIARYPPADLSLFDHPGDPVAHFLMKAMFCLFAESVGLLPGKVFHGVVQRCLFAPDEFVPACSDLFAKMRNGGWYGNVKVPYFNGGLFDDDPPLPLNHPEVNALFRAASQDWSGVEPSIFGTLFERILDPRKRAQIGAHYTSKDDILLVVDPVVIAPLRRRWQAVQDGFAASLAAHDAEHDPKQRDLLSAPIRIAIDDYRNHLHQQRVLDPACGSGNFLYVALQRLLDLEDEVVRFAAKHDVHLDPTPRVRPAQMHGIEINPYAAELAQVVVWIGYLQWINVHGIGDERRPILDKLEMIENRDAILDLSDKANPKRAEWPDAEFIIGNPPFLSGSKLWEGLGIDTRNALWSSFDLAGTCDLCCYWFEIARAHVRGPASSRVGLLATQGIRGVANREVLTRITKDGNIFNAWSDRNWLLDGAAVHVSIVAFDGGNEAQRMLDGRHVTAIYSDLTSDIDLTVARDLIENSSLSFRGTQKGGPFDINWRTARNLLVQPTNTNGVRNDGVLKPWLSGDYLNRRWMGKWIIDFGVDATIGDASGFEGPFRHVEMHVKPSRLKNKRVRRQRFWWLHSETATGMRAALASHPRQLATLRVSKHRLFRWANSAFLSDDGIYVFARSDDYFFGILQSSGHEIWSRRQNSQLRESDSASRYTAEKSFSTFALPWPPGKENVSHPAYQRIDATAKALDEKRERWLNPPEWLEPIAEAVDAADDFADVPADVRPLIRRSAIMAAAAKDGRLKNRTLTKLYNERPTWLRIAHEQLDRAVLAAYAATDPAGGWDEDWAAVWVDSGAGQPLPADHPLAEQRKQTDAAVLAALLRLNGRRANPPPPPVAPTGPADDPSIIEHDSITSCALRFDGLRYIEDTGFDQVAAHRRMREDGKLPDGREQQLALLFILQRWLFKWGGEYLPQTHPDWWAIRTLFLQLWQTDVPTEYSVHMDGWPWDELPYAERQSRAGVVAAIHRSTVYDRLTPIGM